VIAEVDVSTTWRCSTVKEDQKEIHPMDEAAVRQALIENCRRLIAEWEAGRDCRWYGRKGRLFDFDMSDVEIKPDFTDCRSLAAIWAYLDAFIDALNHGFDKLDGIPWEEAFSTLKEITRHLEQGLPVNNEMALTYLQMNNDGCNPFRILFSRSKKRP
jgi:hypothetical protein